MGARHVGIEELPATCWLHDIEHLAALVPQLKPRIWKQMYAGSPLRPDLYEHRRCRRVIA